MQDSEKRAEALLARLERGGLVIDGDVHISDPAALPDWQERRRAEDPNYFHGRTISAEDAVAEMDAAGVDMALVWQNPAATTYGNDPCANYHALLEANRYIAEAAARYPDRFIPAGWTDPKALGLQHACDLVDRLTGEMGMAIVKMNPAQNAFRMASEPVMRVVEHIVARGAVPAFHFGADTPYTPAEDLRALAEAFPQVPVIGVHMGGGGAAYPDADETYAKARQYGLEVPNIFYILSAKRDTHIESDLIAYTAAGPEAAARIACASDAPYGRMAWNFGGFRAMFDTLRAGVPPDPRLAPGMFTDAVVAGYMGDNLARLAAGALRGWLAQRADTRAADAG
ncbi:amidohydrolase family protein [Psychromarinibacter sp. C21-152]|uniref:Amidohydrolase family protein n=1 Tax=Psychromarinibacter sediminicola TaxID=3033385 RepID=A0AAE3T8F5_9RHOB|nr:amidohydrolase family protein [Psychromarinibacter sediminicola]MDF0599440.1 amidohydrolase family protein [Psychromarinibacter sediminicola]